MRGKNILGRRGANISLVLLFILVSQTMLQLPVPTISAASLTAAKIGTRAGRQQSNPVSSGSIAVWEDRKILDLAKYKSTPYSTPDDRGTSDILGFDFSTNQPLTITTDAGDQTVPAISGTVVVWQDTGPNCFTCDRDIKAKDLKTGVDYMVASGPNDQAFPAIDGTTVAWVENGTSLISAQLGSQTSQTIATASAGAHIAPPAISSNLIVWAEYTLGKNSTQSVLKAYDRISGATKVINQSNPGIPTYTVLGYKVAWTGSDLVLTDVQANTRVTLDSQTFANLPTISGNTVYWSGQALGNTSLHQVYGYDLTAKTLKSLPITPGEQQKPVVVGSNLLWQSDESTHSEIFSLPLAQALVDPGQVLTATPKVQEPSAQAPNPVYTRVLPNGATASYTRPTYKGMHAANATGWYVSGTSPCNASSCPAIDGLGATFEPLFGSVLVISSDLGRSTGRGSPWGPTVADAMKYMQNTYGTRIIVRIFPTTQPAVNPNPIPNTPDQVAQQVIALADINQKNYDWIKNIQIANEPNELVEWADNCQPGSNNYCKWSTRSNSYQWTDSTDSRKYQAINDFYSDAWYSINYYKNNYSNLTVRARLQQMAIWTPPLGVLGYAGNLSNGAKPYDYIQGMISLYGLMTYHDYPSPNKNSSGSIVMGNQSWDNEFDAWVKTQINNSTIRTMITELGWYPGEMSNCGVTQHDTWLASQTGNCHPGNNLNHTFDGDLSYYLANSRHSAEAVTVWIENGSPDPKANGIDGNGNPYTWFHNYQFSSP